MESIIPIDLFDISNRLIVKKNSVADYKLVRRLTDHGNKLKKTLVPIGDTELFKDFKNVFNEDKYFTIFTPYSTNEQILRVAKDTKLTTEIFEELKNIKRHFPYTFRHILLVTTLIIKITMDLKNNGYDPEYATLVGLVHDLGKSRIPKQVLAKETPLTSFEYNLVKSHPLLGYLFLCYYLGSSFGEIPHAARDHHEKVDGSGYPRAIKKITKYTRLIAPVDIFDALISERPYRASPFTIRQALDYLIDESIAGKIDKNAVYHLLSYVRKEHPHPEELKPYAKKSQPFSTDNTYGKIVDH